MIDPTGTRYVVHVAPACSLECLLRRDKIGTSQTKPILCCSAQTTSLKGASRGQRYHARRRAGVKSPTKHLPISFRTHAVFERNADNRLIGRTQQVLLQLMTGRFVRRFKPARLSCKRAASFARCDPCKSSAPEAVILFMSRRPPRLWPSSRRRRASVSRRTDGKF